MQNQSPSQDFILKFQVHIKSSFNPSQVPIFIITPPLNLDHMNLDCVEPGWTNGRRTVWTWTIKMKKENQVNPSGVPIITITPLIKEDKTANCQIWPTDWTLTEWKWTSWTWTDRLNLGFVNVDWLNLNGVWAQVWVISTLVQVRSQLQKIRTLVYVLDLRITTLVWTFLVFLSYRGINQFLSGPEW